jgi:ribulose 1,5-bisphosphate synthetase/thiazole synthase
MSFRRISLKAAAIAFIALATATSATIDESKFSAADTIVRDVVILGGGASGSYAAIRLKDFGKTVVVIEEQNHLVT